MVEKEGEKDDNQHAVGGIGRIINMTIASEVDITVDSGEAHENEADSSAVSSDVGVTIELPDNEEF